MLVVPLAQDPDDHQAPHDQRLDAGKRHARQNEGGADRGHDPRDDEHSRAQHQLTGSRTTAVPYATISLMTLPISDESKRIITIAFACMSLAFFTMRSTACRRASSSSCVYSVISPPTMERRPARILPPSPRLRTTTPNTWPLVSLTL